MDSASETDCELPDAGTYMVPLYTILYVGSTRIDQTRLLTNIGSTLNTHFYTGTAEIPTTIPVHRLSANKRIIKIPCDDHALSSIVCLDPELSSQFIPDHDHTINKIDL